MIRGRSGCSFFLLTHLTLSTSWFFSYFIFSSYTVPFHTFYSITRLTRNLNKPRGQKKINHLLKLRFKSNEPNKAYWCKPKRVKTVQRSWSASMNWRQISRTSGVNLGMLLPLKLIGNHTLNIALSLNLYKKSRLGIDNNLKLVSRRKWAHHAVRSQVGATIFWLVIPALF